MEANPENENNNNEAQNNNSERNLSGSTFSFPAIFKNFTYLFTLVLVINVIIYILSLFKIIDTFNYSICLWPIMHKHQYYRILTHNFLHGNFIHILFNMIFFYYVGVKVEKKLGSVLTFVYIYHSMFALSLIYLLIVSTLNYFFIHTLEFKEFNYDFYCSVGFSGVLFSLFYLQCNFTSVANNYSSFLTIPIKAKLLPYCYLVIIQIINPNSSFLGHLSGILAGLLIKKFFVYFTFPSRKMVSNFETMSSSLISCLKSWFNFVDTSSITGTDINEIDQTFLQFWPLSYFYNRCCRRYQPAPRSFDNL